MGLQVRVWGVRGSGPECGPEYQEYGGNTSCVTVHTKDKTVILDAGTGIGHFDRSFKRQMEGKRRRLDLLLSHFHMDHLMGLYGCSFLFDPQMEVHIYGERFGEKGLKECLCRMFGPPYWPLPLDQLPALVRFHEIQAGDVFLLENQIQVHTLRGVHPGGSILYRLEEVGQGPEPASVVYGLDCELTDAMLQKLKEFAGACGLLICDACYTEEELMLRQGWGHGSIERCRKLRQASGAQQALFMHYERSYQDTFLRKQEEMSLAQDPACLFAREGMALKVNGNDR